jgi:hypothetical protein
VDERRPIKAGEKQMLSFLNSETSVAFKKKKTAKTKGGKGKGGGGGGGG